MYMHLSPPALCSVPFSPRLCRYYSIADITPQQKRKRIAFPAAQLPCAGQDPGSLQQGGALKRISAAPLDTNHEMQQSEVKGAAQAPSALGKIF